MPRPQKCRRICELPAVCSFAPAREEERTEDFVEMTVDEYETIRLMDLVGCSQEDCAKQMGVARTTVQAVYNEARRKIAQVLVYGRQLHIRGGSYEICPRSDDCCGKSCGGLSCRRQRCTGEQEGDGCGQRRCRRNQ